jgi:CelD/BcsL family acetyltransferase involved in cellulose biosynthesis
LKVMPPSQLPDGLACQVLALDDDRWLRFVQSSEGALSGHHPSWGSLLAECYGYETFVLALADGADNIVGGLPIADVTVPLIGRKLVSLPFTDYLPPLVASNDLAPLLVAELNSLRRSERVDRVEIRANVGGASSHVTERGFRHVLALDADLDSIFQMFHRSQVQRGIRKAEREGTVVRLGTRIEDLTHVFYSLHAQTRRRLGIPVQPRRFFELLWKRIIDPGLGGLLLAEVGGQALAGVVVLRWGKTATYKYSASASDVSQYRPTHLILWHAIRDAWESGYAQFDFGRTDFDSPGLRSFKLGWGPREEVLAYSMLADDAPTHVHAGPSPLIRSAIRRSPVAVARIVGQLLYKYAP